MATPNKLLLLYIYIYCLLMTVIRYCWVLYLYPTLLLQHIIKRQHYPFMLFIFIIACGLFECSNRTCASFRKGDGGSLTSHLFATLRSEDLDFYRGLVVCNDLRWDVLLNWLNCSSFLLIYNSPTRLMSSRCMREYVSGFCLMSSEQFSTKSLREAVTFWQWYLLQWLYAR
jgi:hypothetical protein